MNEKNANQCLTDQDVEKADKDVVRFYYQQAIETFNFLHKSNESIKNKAGLLMTFLCSAVGFCIKMFIDTDESYSIIFLIASLCFFGIALFVCFKIFLTEVNVSPFYPVQENDDQIAIYKNSLNDVLTTITKENTKPAIIAEKEKNKNLFTHFNMATILTLCTPILSAILYFIFYHFYFLLSLVLLFA